MKHLSKVVILLTAILLCAASCDDLEDGKWPKMKWKNTCDLAKDDGAYLIPEEGGTFTFECKNYPSFWLGVVIVDGIYHDPCDETGDNHSFKGEWYDVKCEGNKLIIKAEPLPSTLESRNFEVGVTAGDIFDGFKFSQQKGWHIWM